MSTLKEDLTAIKEIQDGLVDNKVARFSYTQNAYDANNVNGVDEYNVNNEQNIPNGTASIMKVNSTVLDKGYRAQASSITRMLMNHFLGRISYNLNKINDNMQGLLDTLITKFPTSLPASGGTADNAKIANKVANSLTFGSKTYNGSSAQTIKASDLGLLPPNLEERTTIDIISSSNLNTKIPYTAPYDGWIVDVISFNADYKTITINNIMEGTPNIISPGLVVTPDGTTNFKIKIGLPYPVKKGQIISVDSLGGTVSIVFAPCMSV